MAALPSSRGAAKRPRKPALSPTKGTIPEDGAGCASTSRVRLGPALRQGDKRRKIPANIGLLFLPRPPLDPPLRCNGVYDPFVVLGKDELNRAPFESVTAGDQALSVFAESLLHRASRDSGVVAAIRTLEDINRRAVQSFAPFDSRAPTRPRPWSSFRRPQRPRPEERREATRLEGRRLASVLRGPFLVGKGASGRGGLGSCLGPTPSAAARIAPAPRHARYRLVEPLRVTLFRGLSPAACRNRSLALVQPSAAKSPRPEERCEAARLEGRFEGGGATGHALPD